MTHVNMAHASVNSRVVPLSATEKAGYFKEQGLDVKVVTIRGGTQVTQALLGGASDIAYSDPPAMISAIAAGGPLVEVMSTARLMPFLLVEGPR